MKAPDYTHREWLPDILKGWAVVWMILVHAVELYLVKDQGTHPLARFAMFMGGVPAAPVFMLLMGYFAGRPGKKTSSHLVRGGQLLLWGLLLNIGLNFSLLIRWLFGHADIQPLTYIFGVDILMLAGLSLIAVGLMNLLKPAWYVWLLVGFLVPLINHFIPNVSEHHVQPGIKEFILAPVAGSYSWSYFPLVPWLGYVLVGVGLHRLFAGCKGFLSHKKYRFYAAIPAGLIFLAGLIPAWQVTNNLPVYYHHDLLFFGWALSMIFLLALFAHGLKQVHSYTLGPWIRFLGVRVTTAYVIQWLIIGNLATWIYREMSLSVTLILFVLILFITLILTYIVDNTRSHAKK